jgi:ABC-type branched-subunit amino acid transport system substrate-binding protein
LRIKQKWKIWPRLALVFILLGVVCSSGGCAFPGSTKPVIKIGLIAPFEGEQRPNGYQRLYGVKLALQEVNLSGGIAGYKIELVALNDFADKTETILQAQELVLDSGVRAVIGHQDPVLFKVAAPIYKAAQLAAINPGQFTDFSDLPLTFISDFEALSGSAPDTQAKQTYLATYRLLQAVEKAVHQTGKPERVSVLKAFNHIK